MNIQELVNQERPDWNAIMNYVTLIYKHFELNEMNDNGGASINNNNILISSTSSSATPSTSSSRSSSSSPTTILQTQRLTSSLTKD